MNNNSTNIARRFELIVNRVDRSHPFGCPCVGRPWPFALRLTSLPRSNLKPCRDASTHAMGKADREGERKGEREREKEKKRQNEQNTHPCVVACPHLTMPSHACGQLVGISPRREINPRVHQGSVAVVAVVAVTHAAGTHDAGTHAARERERGRAGRCLAAAWEECASDRRVTGTGPRTTRMTMTRGERHDVRGSRVPRFPAPFLSLPAFESHGDGTGYSARRD